MTKGAGRFGPFQNDRPISTAGILGALFKRSWFTTQIRYFFYVSTNARRQSKENKNETSAHNQNQCQARRAKNNATLGGQRQTRADINDKRNHRQAGRQWPKSTPTRGAEQRKIKRNRRTRPKRYGPEPTPNASQD